MSKISIRFFGDKEVRAVWDEANAQWRFAAVDLVAAIRGEVDHKKASNYWRWLKKKLANQNAQLVSDTHGFKMLAPDGKHRTADTLTASGIEELAKSFPGNRAAGFLDWFLYSDNTIDGQSKKKAYVFWHNLANYRDDA